MTNENRPVPKPRRSRTRVLLTAAGLALVIGGGATLAIGAVVAQNAPSYAVQAAAHRYRAPSATTAAVAAAVTSANPSATPAVRSTGRLTIPTVGLDAPLLNMKVPANGILDPPTIWDAYLIGGYGTPRDAGSGTTFIAMHSGRGLSHALGDAIVDRNTGRPALKPGAKIIVDGVTFVVTGSQVLHKGSLHDDPEIWSGAHALIAVTCEQFSDGRPSENAIIFADRP